MRGPNNSSSSGTFCSDRSPASITSSLLFKLPPNFPLTRSIVALDVAMSAVNQNMFATGIPMDCPGGASLMVLPLNLIAQIVSYVSSPPIMTI